MTKPNPIRVAILQRMRLAAIAHNTRANLGDLTHLQEYQALNQEFLDRARGKGRNVPFLKSCLSKGKKTTFFPVSKRNGRKEASRRYAQMHPYNKYIAA